MITGKLRDAAYVQQLKDAFAVAKPYKHVVIDNFLEPAFAHSLADNFPLLNNMRTQYSGINEKKAEHSNLESLNTVFKELQETLFNPSFISCVEEISDIRCLQVINDRFGYGLHQGGNGSFLDIHIDYNLHPIKKKQRRLNLLIFLNEEWRDEWGGLLQFWNADVTKCVTSIAPTFNRCVIFECNEISYHGYDQITCPENITRKSFYTYFFSEPSKKIAFHDTVFKPLPKDSLFKKIVVTGKEKMKNKIKNLLYKLGLLK